MKNAALLAVLFIVLAGGGLHAQGAAVNDVTIPLGQSVVALNGPWKFTIGDSPIDPATHQPLWAEPSFDDFHWENVDLSPPPGSIDPVFGISGYVPGWTAKGHPGYSGYAWYRIRVKLNAHTGEKLALEGPNDFEDVYQVFANGVLLGGFGDFSASHPAAYSSQPAFFAIPSSAVNKTEDGAEVLAFRFWMDPSTPTYTPDAGGFHDAPLLGQAVAVAASYQLDWVHLIRTYASAPLEGLLFLMLTVLALSLTLFDRSDKLYYWIAAAFLLSVLNSMLLAIEAWTQLGSVQTMDILNEVLLSPLILGAWVMVWRAWFQLKRPTWLPRAVVVLTLLYMAGALLGEQTIFGLVSAHAAAPFHLLSVCARLAFLALLALTVILGIRQQGREGWLALPAVVLLGISRFQNELAVLHINEIWFPFGVSFTLFQMTQVLLMIALFILLLRRLLLSLRAQRQQALDIKSAAEVQQVILPEPHMTFPGLTIETEYRPAREVGGDFFQIIPDPTDGSLLIVAGDVTGKGLKAGMLVALLVGAIRTAAETNSDPLFLLQALNRRLVGRGDAQATCLALRIAGDGEVTLANAGHVAPYLNCEPVPMEGALPLGMIEGVEFSVMHFQLDDGDWLVLMSDGVAEATDANGDLFGFERLQELLRSVKSGADVANAAQSFGQEDDISVITVTRTVVPDPSIA